MRAIVGIGNPGAQYAQTRHNAGTIFIEWLVKNKLKPKIVKNTSRYTLYGIDDNLIVCNSETFMNESGKAVHAILRNYPNLVAKNVLIVHDDL